MLCSARLPHENTPALVRLHRLTKAHLLGHAGLPKSSEASQAPFRLPKSWKKSCRIFCCQRPCPRSARREAFAYWQGTTSGRP